MPFGVQLLRISAAVVVIGAQYLIGVRSRP